MITQIKGIRLACPECKIPFETHVRPVDNHELVCSKCHHRYPIWGGRPCLLPQSNHGLNPVWKNAFEKEKNRPPLQKALLKLGQRLHAPRMTPRKKPHFDLLAALEKDGPFKALFVGYNRNFEDRLSRNIIQIDVIPKEYVDIVAMWEFVPFPDNAFDLVVISGVIEHTQYPFKVMDEAYRLLKPRGKVYVSSPWVYPFHNGDNYRFSHEGLQLLCNRFSNMEIGSLDGPLHALGIFLLYLTAEYLSFGNRYLRYILSLFFSWLVFPLFLIDVLINNPNKSKCVLDANIYAIATKEK
ncbi:MAG TPA: methyltransferase domain-containing protein [Desulfatiglandales bacterium]|nr:methyltransferase domain-containing protein [Desulfatiglandales bacterium]